MAPGVSSCRYGEVAPSISFAGSGFMVTYQLGVTQCLISYAPWILRTAPWVLGASAGSLVAASVVCEISPITIRDEILHFARQLQDFTLGPFNPSINVFQWLDCVLRKHLPSDAHQLANGRLAVAMTRLSDGKHTVMSDFESKEDVVQALLCSCFVPGYCGFLPPSYKGVHYVDGGFSRMVPVLPVPCSEILTVSPFSGETDICPADNCSTWEMVVGGCTVKVNMANSFRVINALYPMALETLEQAFDSGYKDAIHFLLRNDFTHSPLNSHKMKEWMRMDTTVEEDEDEEEMKSTLTTFTDDKSMQMDISAERELTKNQSFQKDPLSSDILKNVLLVNVMAYVSMFGLPARILSYLVLPLMLLLDTALQNRQRLELLVKQAPELAFWAWHGMRHFFIFFFNIVVCTLKKNIKDRVMPFILLLQWLKIQTQLEALVWRQQATSSKTSLSALSDNTNCGSVHRQLITPTQDHDKPKLHFM